MIRSPCINSEGRPKIRYATRADAKRAARIDFPGDKRIRSYPCPVCNGFHIGHQPPDSGIRQHMRERQEQQ